MDLEDVLFEADLNIQHDEEHNHHQQQQEKMEDEKIDADAVLSQEDVETLILEAQANTPI